jgi:Cft2 family RNA processing exonuclease
MIRPKLPGTGRTGRPRTQSWVQLSFDAPRTTIAYDRGLRVEGIDLWLDPHVRRPVAYVSHGHSDHCRAHGHAYVTPETADFYRHRTGKSALSVLHLGEPMAMGSHEVELFPAGHVLGSSQARVRDLVTGHVIVYTGDFKLRSSHTLPTAPILKCDTLVMECTYGAPRYRFPPTEQVIAELLAWVRDALEDGCTPVVCGYALGKAQEAMAILARAGHTVAIHSSVAPYAATYVKHGVDLGEFAVLPEGPDWLVGVAPGTVVVCPPHHVKTITVGTLRVRVIVLTGWAVDGGAPWRRNGPSSLPLSDHAGFDDLVAYVKGAAPTIVYTVHGNGGFAAHLRREGIEAVHLGQ